MKTAVCAAHSCRRKTQIRNFMFHHQFALVIPNHRPHFCPFRTFFKISERRAAELQNETIAGSMLQVANVVAAWFQAVFGEVRPLPGVVLNLGPGASIRNKEKQSASSS